MKIIKQVDTSSWVFRHSCNKCETVFEAEESDLCCLTYDGDVREPACTVFHVYCPVCSNQVTVPSKDIPKVMQVRVQEKKASRNYGGGGYFDR